jgi:branched-chain amino acid transport system substrate-binding protein
MNLRRLLVLVTLILGVGALTAVIATAGSASATAQTRVLTPGAAELKGSVVKVGLIYTQSGPAAVDPGMAAVLVASARAINRSGGVHGHPLAVVLCNDQYDPNQTAACAREMVDQKVVAITGGLSTFDSNSYPIISAANSPMIGVTPAGAAENNGPNVYLFNVPLPVQFEILAAYGIHKNYLPQSGALIDVPAAHGYETLIGDAIKPINKGNAWSPIVYVPPTTADFAPYAAKIAAEGPKSTLFIMSGSLAYSTLRSVDQQAPNLRMYGLAASFAAADINKNLPSSVVSRIVTLQTYPPFSDPRMKPFIKALAAERARGDINAVPDQLLPRDVDAWAALQVLVKITKTMKTINNLTVMAALNKAKNLDIGPFLGKWTPNGPGVPGISRASNHAGWLVGYRSGKQVLLVNHPVSVNDALKGKF